MKHILTSSTIKGTANMKLQLFGLYTVIKAAQERNILVTTNVLIDISGLGRSSISNLIGVLQAEGFVEITKIHASHGRGQAYTFKAIAPEALLKEVFKGYLKK